MAQPGALPRRARRPAGLPAGQAREDLIMGYLFILPALTILGVFLFWPILQTLFMSFFRWDLLTQERRFVGLTNYRLILASEDFHLALRNTIYYVLGVVPAQTVAALLLALAANQKIRGRAFFRAAFYFPSISSTVVVALLFLLILQGGGLLDWVVTLLGGTPPRPPWLANPNGVFQLMVAPLGWQLPWWAVGPSIALLSIIGLNIWTTTGSMMVIFLAGLQSIPPDVYEAATVDGATGVQRFRYVTLPLLRPVTLFVVAVGLIGAFQVFDQIWLMTKGQDGTTTLVYLIYAESFGGGFRAGYAAALAVVLLVIIFVVTAIQRRVYATPADL
jgi:multiple sugar transport system permease protein